MRPEDQETIRRARANLDQARRTYKHVLVDMHNTGYSIRQIARAAGVTHGAVHQMIKPKKNTPPPPNP